jgi:lipoate-protein ligase A
VVDSVTSVEKPHDLRIAFERHEVGAIRRTTWTDHQTGGLQMLHAGFSLNRSGIMHLNRHALAASHLCNVLYNNLMQFINVMMCEIFRRHSTTGCAIARQMSDIIGPGIPTV